MSSPQTIAAAPHSPLTLRLCREDSDTRQKDGKYAASRHSAQRPYKMTNEKTVKTDRPEANAELHSFEPLRTVFAVLALLLGLIAAMHL